MNLFICKHIELTIFSFIILPKQMATASYNGAICFVSDNEEQREVGNVEGKSTIEGIYDYYVNDLEDKLVNG